MEVRGSYPYTCNIPSAIFFQSGYSLSFSRFWSTLAAEIFGSAKAAETSRGASMIAARSAV